MHLVFSPGYDCFRSFGVLGLLWSPIAAYTSARVTTRGLNTRRLRHHRGNLFDSVVFALGISVVQSA